MRDAASDMLGELSKDGEVFRLEAHATDANAPNTVTGGFRGILRNHGGNVALIDEDGCETSYQALLAKAEEFAARIGSRRRLVFLEAKNNPASIGAYIGCLIGGHPVYLYQKQDELLLSELVQRYLPNIIVENDGAQIAVSEFHTDSVALHPDLRLLLSTSGSTGSPKFVKLSERNLISNARSIAEYLQIGPADRAITSLKFNYSYGMSVINSHLVSGACLLLTERSVNEPGFWELFRVHGATSFAGVPYTFETLAKMEHYLDRVPSLRYVTQAGGRLSPELVRHFAARGRKDGWRFYVMYGQTEAGPRISYLPPDMAERYPGSIGRAIPGGTIEILDEHGAAIAEPGKPGELAYRGPNVMMGYAEGPAALESDHSPGRLLTGDIAQWNDAGLVDIVGRTGRFVKPFGLRVNLDEVETLVRKSAPNAVCTGTDETVILALIRSDGVDGAGIVAELSRVYRLPAFVFKVVELDEIPRLPNGKTAYREIIDKAGIVKRDDAQRGAKSRIELILARNQMVTLLISGLWHGPAWTFVSWGAFHGVMLVLQRQVVRRVEAIFGGEARWRRVVVPLQIGVVFLMVLMSRVLFRSESMADAWLVFASIFQGPYHLSELDGKARLAVCFMIIAGVLAAEAGVEYGLWRRYLARRRTVRAMAAILVLIIAVLLGEYSGGRYIYVRF